MSAFLVAGLSTDEWRAIATFAGPLGAALSAAFLAVWFGGSRFRAEVEARDVRRYLVEEGALKLKASLDSWLEATRRNYTLAEHLLRYIRDIPYDHPARPRPEELPVLFPTEALAFNFEAIAPTSRLLGGTGIGALMTHAFADLYNVNLDFQTQISQPIRSYYERKALAESVNHVQLYEQLTNLARRRYHRAELYGPLSQWLEDAGLRVQELHITRFADIRRLHKDEEIIALQHQVAELLAIVEREGDQAEPPLEARQ